MVDTRELDRPQFDSLAERYSQFRTGYSEQAVRAIAEEIPSSGRVLDVATGTGILSDQLASHVASIVGCDMSLAMVRAAAGPVIQAVAERLPFPDGTFDAVTCSQAFHWFDAKQAAAEFHRVVRSRGIIAILRKGSHPDEPYERMADQLIEELTGKPQDRWNPPVPHELGALRELRFSWEAHWTVEEYVGWMSSRESIRQLLSGRLGEFLRHLRDRLVAVAPQETFRERQIDHLFLARG